jgi:hypothetical protein
MFRSIRNCFFLALICFGFTACQQHPSGTRYIPKDALGIFCLNIDNISSKVTWSVLADSRIFNGMSHDSSFDIEATGVDPHASIYAFGLPDSRLKSGFKFLTVFPLKDEKKFSEYLKKTFPSAKQEASGQLQWAVISPNNCIAWNKKTAISAYASRNIAVSDHPDTPGSLSFLKETIKESFALPKAQSIAANKLYAALTREDHDFSFWFNLEAFSKAMPQEDMETANAILSSQKKLLKNTFIDGGIDFKKGRVEAEGKFYHNPSGTAVAKAFLPEHYDDDMLRKIPGNKLDLMLHLQMNPKGMATFLDTIGVLPITKMALKENGLSPDSVLNLFSGNFLLTVVDFNFKNFISNFNSFLEDDQPVPFAQAALTFKIKEPGSFQKLLDMAVQQHLITQLGDHLYHARNYYLSWKDDYVVVSPFRETAQILLADSTSKDWHIPPDIKNNPFGLYLNVQNIVNAFSDEMKQGGKDSMALHLIDNIQVYGGKIKDNYSAFHATIYFQNKEENSLLQLINLGKEIRQ